MLLQCNTKYINSPAHLVRAHYSNKRMALRLVSAIDSSPLAIVTVNIPSVELNEGEIIIKHYAENEGILEFLQANNIVGKIKGWVRTGRIEVPIVDLLIIP